MHRKQSKTIKKNVLVICQYYYPENFQITPICEQLVTDGYAVTVLTGLPNYPTGVIPPEYRKGNREEYINGVHVIRCFEIPRGKGTIKLAMNYLSYSLAALRKIKKLEENFDLVFVYQLSPILMGLPGIQYSKKYKVPLFLYCCDLWPESLKLYVKNEENVVFKIVKKLSTKIYQSADIVAYQSSSFRPYLLKTHDLDKKRLIYMPAFADESYLVTDFTPENEIVDFVFMGNLGIAQNLTAVLMAIEKIRNIPGFKVHFVGDGTCLDEMKKIVSEKGMDDIVMFYGRRPVEEMPKYYKLADACLVSLKADNATGLTLPSKVQGYMAAGKPILGMIDGSAKEVIEEANCGICVKANDIDGFASAMKQFILNRKTLNNLGDNGRQYFQDNFGKEIFISKLEQIFEELTR